MIEPAKLEAEEICRRRWRRYLRSGLRGCRRAQLRGSDRRKWPFTGIPTFLDAPCRPDAHDLPDFSGVDIALLGVPMDLGVTNRNCSRFGSRAVRTIERIGSWDHVLKCAPFSMAPIADIGDVPMRFDLALCR